MEVRAVVVGSHERPSTILKWVVAGIGALGLGCTVVLLPVWGHRGFSVWLLPVFLMLLLLSALVARLPDVMVLLVVAGWLAFQNVFVTALAPVVAPRVVQLLLAAKMIVLGVVAALRIWERRWPRITPVLWGAISLLALNGLYLLLPSEAGWTARVAIFRENVVLILFFLAGTTMNLKEGEVAYLVRGLVSIAMAMVLFGYVEHFLLGFPFWKALGIYELSEAKGVTDTYFFLPGGIPGNFVFYDFGVPIHRMVGPLADPTLFSHYLALPMLLLLAGREVLGLDRRVWVGLVLVLGSAIALSLGRGGLLVVLCGLGLLLWLEARRWRLVLLLLALGGGGVLLLFGLKSGIFSLAPDSSGARHLGGLLLNLQGLAEHPLGHGLGTAGNLAKVFARGSLKGGAGESFVGSLAWQLGLPGVLGWALFCLSVAWSLVSTPGRGPRSEGASARLYRVVGVSLVGIFLTSVVSESAVAATGSGLAYLLAGALVASRPAPRPREPVEDPILGGAA